MRIVSLNAWGGVLYDDLVSWLVTVEPDVLCLQEVTRTRGLDGWTRFEDDERALPQRADLHADIVARLGLHGRFTPFDSGPVYDARGRRFVQEFGLATYVRRTLVQPDEVEWSYAFIHGQYQQHARWPLVGRPRAAQAIRLKVPTGPRHLTVAHCHGLRDPRGKGDTRDRRDQAVKLAEFVERAWHREDLIVVAGDFNTLPDSVMLQALRRNSLVDLVGGSGTRSSHYPGHVLHADYLLVSGSVVVENFAIIRAPEVSDHCPLVLDLDVNGGH